MPHCVCFTLDSVDAICLTKIVELPLKFCATVMYQGLWLSDLLYVDLKCMQHIRLVDDQVGKAVPSEAVDCHKHILEQSKACFRVRSV